MYDRNQYIEIIIDKLFSAFRGQWEFLLEIGRRIVDRAETELRFDNIHKDKEFNNDEQNH